MHKQDLAERLASRFDLTTNRAEAIINSIFDPETGLIAEAIIAGDGAVMTGFGTFSRVRRAGRSVVHPANGLPMEVPPRMGVRFTPGTPLLRRVKAIPPG